MTAPTLVSWGATSGDSHSTPYSLPSVTVQTGDVIVVAITCGEALSGGVPSYTVSGGGLTWTAQKQTRVSGYPNIEIWTATAASSGSLSITASWASATWRSSFEIGVYRGSGGIGASSKSTGAGPVAPSIALTTTDNNSAIAFFAAQTGQVGTTPTLATLGSGTATRKNWDWYDDGQGDLSAERFSVAYSDSGTAGAKTVGATVPTGWYIDAVAAIEILGAVAATNGTINITEANETASIATAYPVTIAITEANETATISTTVTTNVSLTLTEANETTAINGSQVGAATVNITEANETVVISGHATQPASIVITEANETTSIIGNATGTATPTPTPMAIKLAPFFSTDIIDSTGPIFQLYKINDSGVMVADYGPNSTDIVAIPNVVNGYAAILTDANMTVDTDGGYRGAIVWSTGGETPMYIMDEFYIPPTATGGSGGTLDSTTLAQIAAIKAKTDNLPAAPADESLIIAATNAIVSDTATIKAKTNQLTFTIANQVDSNALTGGGSISAASVRSAIGMASANLDTQLAALPTVTALSTALGTADDATLAQIALVKAKTDNLPAAPAAASDCISAAGVRAAVGLSSANIDTQLAALPSATAIRNAVLDASQAAHMTAGTIGAGIAAASSSGDPWATVLPGGYAAGTAGYKIGTASNMGAGAITWPYTITNSQTGLPIADVKVWAATDSEGLNIIASGLTDQNGSITFYLDAGTVYLFRQKSGFNFTNPDVEVVA